MPDLTLLTIAGLGGLAIAVSKIVRRFVPEIIVFLALGVLIGPEGPFAVINATNIVGLQLVTEVALAAIIFLIGDRLRIDDLRNLRSLLLPLNAAQLAATGVLVFVVLQALGVDVRVSVVLALIAAETGVLTVTATVKEERAAGAFTDLVLSSVALTNVAVAALFGLAFPVILATTGGTAGSGPIWQVFAQIVVGSTAVGLLGGLLLRTYGPAIQTSGELLLFLLLVLTGMTGATIAIEGSVVGTALVAGLFVANASPWLADRFFAAVRTLEAPIYLIFFVVAGADIHFDQLAAAGAIGLAYVLARTVGKIGGSVLGTVAGGGPGRARVGARTGLSLLPHAGMAIALASFVSQFAPEIGDSVAPVVLGSIVVFELSGPLLMRRMLRASGEAGQVDASLDPVLPALDVTRPIRRVLVPVGDAEVVVPRLPFLFDLVGNLGAEVIALHVSAPDDGTTVDEEPELLSLFRAVAGERGVPCTIVHRVAEPVAQTIVGVAEQEGADLIVMGEPARTSLLEPMRWGLVGQRVVRDSTVPVLVYPVDPGRPDHVPSVYLRGALEATASGDSETEETSAARSASSRGEDGAP